VAVLVNSSWFVVLGRKRVGATLVVARFFPNVASDVSAGRKQTPDTVWLKVRGSWYEKQTPDTMVGRYVARKKKSSYKFPGQGHHK